MAEKRGGRERMKRGEMEAACRCLVQGLCLRLAVLVSCASLLFPPSSPRWGAAAVKMDPMERLFWRPNPIYTNQRGKDGDFVRFSDDSSTSREEEMWSRVEQKPVKPGSTKGRYQATARTRPMTWVRSGDPDHPNMRIPMEHGQERTANLLPENSYWKDHDSELDGGHPNERVLNFLAMNSSEASDDFWRQMEPFDLDRWRDENYDATIEKYGLKDFKKVQHLVPKMWFEPLSSGDEAEEFRQAKEFVRHDPEDDIPHAGNPFCVKCGMTLGVARRDLNLEADPNDPRCRFCGFVNAHDGTGSILNDPEVNMVEFGPGLAVLQAGLRQNEEWFHHLDAKGGEQMQRGPIRKETEMRCESCGYNKCYYWTAQVRSIDEGATAFFECKRCKHGWSEKG